MRTSFNTDMKLAHYYPESYYYPPSGMRVFAFTVTGENIGALSVDFETEVLYSGKDDRPYVMLRVQRFNEVDSEPGFIVREVPARLNDIIVLMRGEIHVYREPIFRATFASGTGTESYETPADVRRQIMLAEPVDQKRVEHWAELVTKAQKHGAGSDVWHDTEMHETVAGDPPKPSPHPRLDLDRIIHDELPVYVAEEGGKIYRGRVKTLRDAPHHKGMFAGSECYVDFDEGSGGKWVHQKDLHLVDPTPQDASLEFIKGTFVTTPDEGAGEIVEGPNDAGKYFVTLHEGGAKWYEPADLRLDTRSAQQGL